MGQNVRRTLNVEKVRRIRWRRRRYNNEPSRGIRTRREHDPPHPPPTVITARTRRPNPNRGPGFYVRSRDRVPG